MIKCANLLSRMEDDPNEHPEAKNHCIGCWLVKINDYNYN